MIGLIVTSADDLNVLFYQQQHIFSFQYPRAMMALWRFTDRPCTLPGKCGWRDLAYAEPFANPPVVTFHPKIIGRKTENVIALIRHELGHVVDVDVDKPGREQRADDIAERVTGQKIRYDERDVQTLDPAGRWPRPLWLHR